MANNPTDRRYTKTHEWAKIDGDAVIIGITDFAQHQLSDITYADLPPAGKHFETGEEMAVLESIKAAADVYSPVPGTIVETNAALADNPGVINSDPFNAGWLVKIKTDAPNDLAGLMSAADYAAQEGKES